MTNTINTTLNTLRTSGLTAPTARTFAGMISTMVWVDAFGRTTVGEEIPEEVEALVARYVPGGWATVAAEAADAGAEVIRRRGGAVGPGDWFEHRSAFEARLIERLLAL